jgi:hypothetical protein
MLRKVIGTVVSVYSVAVVRIVQTAVTAMMHLSAALNIKEDADTRSTRF